MVSLSGIQELAQIKVTDLNLYLIWMVNTLYRGWEIFTQYTTLFSTLFQLCFHKLEIFDLDQINGKGIDFLSYLVLYVWKSRWYVDVLITFIVISVPIWSIDYNLYTISSLWTIWLYNTTIVILLSWPPKYLECIITPGVWFKDN